MSEVLFAVDLETVHRALHHWWPLVRSLGEFGPSGWHWHVGWPDDPDNRGSVIITQAERDGHEWLHASIAYPNRTPSYEDLAALHRAVFGRRRWAYQVFAPASEHVNIHAHALHLFGRADGTNPLPAFAEGGSI